MKTVKKHMMLCLLLGILWSDSCWVSSFGFPASRAQGRLAVTTSPQLIKVFQEPIIILNESSSPASVEGSTCHQCRSCDVAFASRNALFRHVRSDPICSRLANDGNPYSQLSRPKRQTIALLFQYHSTSPTNRSIHDDGAVQQQSEAKVAGDSLRGAIKQAIESLVHKEYDMVTSGVEIISTTQATVSKHRHLSLAQETCCAAAGDVMVLSFLAPAVITCNELNREDRERQKSFLCGLLTKANKILLRQATKSSSLLVEILSAKLWASDSRLHAERSCTQRVYHYLLPLKWLPKGEEIEQWWLQSEEYNSRLSVGDRGSHDETRAPTRPPSGSLHLLKDALRSAESASVTPNEQSADLIRGAPGRFGALANKMRRPFHNYNEPVWRVVDRARVVQFQTWKDPLNDKKMKYSPCWNFVAMTFFRNK